ncbi:MAG TPA: PAS domain-containing protein, partial [Candidatus Solibacter sp.]|nr:PAS domain-containing protein [Candidatus Solibacter sp.]
MKDKDRKFQFLFEENPQPMWVFDPGSQQILEANQAAAQLYGYVREEFRGMGLASIEESDTPKAGNDVAPAVAIHRHRTRGG